MIRCSDLSINYGDFEAIKNVNLHVEKNSSCAIIGRSGSGKTTLLHAISGLNQKHAGEITIDGKKVQGVRPSTSIILQKNSLFPWKTVKENLTLALPNIKDFRKNSTKVESVMAELEIEMHGDKYPSELSGGERQRVAIGRGLISSADLLIMDEPTASLDAITKEVIQNLILNLHKTHKVTFIAVTHDIEEAVFLGGKILILKNGEISASFSNELFGTFEPRKQLAFYEKCIMLREVLD